MRPFVLLLLAACAKDAGTETDSPDTDPSDTDVNVGPDRDGDGSPDAVDCAPDDALRAPDMAEACDLVDDDCDGKNTDIVHSRSMVRTDATGAALWTWVDDFDADGRPLRSTYDNGYDSQEIVYDYGPNGLLETRGTYDSPSYHVETLLVHTRDAEGRMLSERFDAQNDGIFDNWNVCAWESDGSSLCEYGPVVDGERKVSYKNRYDAHGTQVSYEYDGAYDGVFEVRHTFNATYDADGHTLRLETDTGADGVIDGVTENTWTDGRLATSRGDNNSDGVWDFTATHTWTATGDRLSYEQVWPASPTSSFRYDQTWDAHGRLLTFAHDTQLDGVDYRIATAYPSDTASVASHDSGADGDVDETEIVNLSCP